MTDAPSAQPQSAPSDSIWGPALKEAGVAFLAAALLLTIFYVFAFRWIHPEFVPFIGREATKLIAPGKDLIPVSVGRYRVEGTSTIIEDFNGDEAILALPRSFQAEDYPFIKVNLQGFTRYSKFKILWRRAADPSQTHALEFNRSGDKASQIAMVYGNEHYRGEIADIALLFFDGPAIGFENNGDEDIIIESIEFRPFSTWRVAEQVLEDWTHPPLLHHGSNNFVRGSHSNSLLFPNAVINSAVTIGIALVCSLSLARRSKTAGDPRRLFAVALSICLWGWLANESLRWTWRLEQIEDTYNRFAGHPMEQRIRNSDMRCSRYPSDCKAEILPKF